MYGITMNGCSHFPCRQRRVHGHHLFRGTWTGGRSQLSGRGISRQVSWPATGEVQRRRQHGPGLLRVGRRLSQAAETLATTISQSEVVRRGKLFPDTRGEQAQRLCRESPDAGAGSSVRWRTACKDKGHTAHLTPAQEKRCSEASRRHRMRNSEVDSEKRQATGSRRNVVPSLQDS